MESLILNLQSNNTIQAYMADNHCMPYEQTIFNEMLTAITNKDQHLLDWFSSFGDSFRAITMNVHAYRKGLEFGFTEIGFDQYGWFTRPAFLDKEELTFGDTSRYGNYSQIDLGRGPNGVWTYALHYSFGTAGGGYGLSVYGKQFNSRDAALNAALADLKNEMTDKVGNTDTLNYKQDIIRKTLADIDNMLINIIQLSLF